MTAEAIDLLGVNALDLAGWLDGATEIVADLDDEDCVRFLSQLEQIAAAVKGAQGAAKLRLLQLLEPGQSCTAPGHGKVTVEAKGKQVTHGSRLARAIAARVADTAVDRETGEKKPPGVLCQDVADELTDVFGLDTASTSFRAGKVEARNLKPGAYRDWEDGAASIRFEAG